MIKRLLDKTSSRREWIILVTLSLIVILLRLPSLEQPFDNDSGANAYHARLIMRGEPLYSTHHPAHHMPGVYYSYALAFLLFGDSTWSVKFLLIPWTVATVFLLYRLGTLVMDRPTGLLAAFFYAILSSHVQLFGTTAEIELFANLPRVAALLVMLHLTTRDTSARAASARPAVRPWTFAFVGLLSATAFLFKAVYLSPLALAGLVLLAQLWRARTTPGAWRTVVARGIWIGVGFAITLLLVVAYFALEGLLPRFLLTFTMGRDYVSFRNSATLGYGYLAIVLPLLGLGLNNAVLLACSLGGFLVTFINAFRGRHRTRGSSKPLYISAWYILSFVEATITRTCFLHYYLLIVPPLALLAAWFLLKLYRDLRHSSRAAAIALPAILLIAALVISAIQNFDHYRLYARYKLGLGSYEDFVVRGWNVLGAQALRAQKLADYVQARTSPDEYVYYWSGAVQLYYLADRRCPIDIIWPLYIEATGPHERIFGPRTKYIIVGDSNNIARPDWLYPALAEEGYTLETIIDEQEIYRRTGGH